MKKLTTLDFSLLRSVNVDRCNQAFFPLDSKDGPWWGNAMAGECGEACNIVKKIDRDGDSPQFREMLAEELADVVTYADLLAARFGIDLGAAVIAKFNKVSERRNCEIFLNEGFPLTDPEKDKVIRSLTRQLDAAVAELNAQPMAVLTAKPMSDEVRAQLENRDIVQRRLYCNKHGLWFIESRVLFKEGKVSAWGLDTPDPVSYANARESASIQGIKLEPDYIEDPDAPAV